MARNQRGFTIIELMVVVAVLAVLTLISFTVYHNVQSRSRLAKAQADTRTMAGAIGAFQAHMGQMPAVLSDLTVSQTNASGQASVWVVNAQNVVEQRAIQTSSISGDKWIVSSGLNAGDRVVVEGLQKVRAGAPVTAVPFQTGNTNASATTH